MNQLSLPVEVDPPARPQKRSGELIQHVAEQLAIQIGESGLPGVIEDLIAVLEGSTGFDGYELARELEDNFGWGIDAALVDVLDSASALHHFAHEQKVKEWVQRFNVRISFAVGQRVVTNRKNERGVIVRLFEETAECLVRLDDERDPSYAGTLLPVECLQSEVNDG